MSSRLIYDTQVRTPPESLIGMENRGRCVVFGAVAWKHLEASERTTNRVFIKRSHPAVWSGEVGHA